MSALTQLYRELPCPPAWVGQRAQEFVAHRLMTASPNERHELEEWAALLRTGSPQRLRHVLLDPGERATRLRQTWPFAGLLNETERNS